MPFSSRIKLLMNNPNYQEEYKVFQENNQLVLVLNSEILLPEDAPVRVTSAQLEEQDYRKLFRQIAEALCMDGAGAEFFDLGAGIHMNQCF